MTVDQRADEIIARYGMPKGRELLHAMLCYAVQQGKMDGAMEMSLSMAEVLQSQELPPILQKQAG